jgi:hypothetical protein
VDSRISALITAGNQSVPVSDPVQKALEQEPKAYMNLFGKQKSHPLDSNQPYQCPEASFRSARIRSFHGQTFSQEIEVARRP